MSIAVNTDFADIVRARLVEDSSDDGSEQHPDYWLDIALEDSFPCSDPISSMRTD
jgi:hypothetical protein